MAARQPWYERGWWLLKVTVFIISCAFIGWHIRAELGLVGRAPDFFRLSALSSAGIWGVLLLALLNWSLEALKWKYLMAKVEQVDFITALRAFFNGITVSFFTPNRTGEFAGRVLYLQRDVAIPGALLTFIGSTAQLLVTLQCGALAAMVYTGLFIELDRPVLVAVRCALLLFVLLCSLAWWQMPRLVQFTDRLHIRPAWKEKVHVWDQCTTSDKLYVWALSVFRYAVFTTQAVLMYQAAGITAGWMELAGLTALSYFFITLIPSIALGELGIRGGVNIALFGYAGALSSDILLATFGIWMINLVLPALLGALSLLFLKKRRRSSI